MKLSQLKIALYIAAMFLLSTARANVVGVSVQNFNPITSGLDFVTVHSSETLRPCNFNCGVFVNYAKNSLPNFKLSSTTDSNFDDSVISSDFNFGVGLTDRWDFGLSVASVLKSDAGDSSTIEYDVKGLNDIRLNTKYRFTGDRDGGIAAVLSANFTQIENSPYEGIDPGPSFNLELVADTTLSNRIAIAGNIGYRFKSKGTPVDNTDSGFTSLANGIQIEPMGDQWIASVAASYYFESSHTKLIGELYASLPADDDSEDSFTDELKTIEALIGVKHDFSTALAGHFGGTIGLLDGTASPDWRVYAGINWAFGPLSFCKKKPAIIRVEEDQTPAEAIDEAPMAIAEGEPEQNPFTNEPKQNEERFVISNVLFDTDKDTLKPEGEEAVAHLAGYLTREEGFRSLLIEGHTDSMSSDAYNLDLSRRRAKQVKRELIRLGVKDTNNITTRGYGEARPIADNANSQGRALNRRVEFVVKWK